jgi:hypothetical protein
MVREVFAWMGKRSARKLTKKQRVERAALGGKAKARNARRKKRLKEKSQ